MTKPRTILKRGGQVLLFLALLLAADRVADRLLKTGLERYFGLNRPADAVCIGHSRTVLGIDREALSKKLGMRVAKYGMDGVNTFDRYAMTHYFLNKHSETKMVIYDVESVSFTTAMLSANSYKLFLPFMDDPAMADYVRQNSPSRLQYFIYSLLHTTRYDDAAFNRSLRGWLGYDENLKQGNVDLKRLQARIAAGRIRSARVDADNLRAFEQLMDELTAKGIQVILWHPPTIDILDDIDHQKREEVRSIFRQLAASNPKIEYYEFVVPYRSQHAIFYDGIHLNAKGRRLITDKLAECINSGSD